MTAIINGDSPSITFSDATTQATSAVVSGKVPYSILPAGSVLQVVQATTSTAFSTSSTSYVTTGFSSSITPKFSTSKILVTFSGRIYSNTAGNEASMAIYRGASSIWGGNTGFSAGSATAAQQGINYLDNPATTSNTTYTLYLKTAIGNAVFMPNNAGDGIATITLMEIAA